MSAAERTALSKKPFRFFDLPRELRDIIYDFLPYGRRVTQEAKTHDAYRLWQGDRPLQQFALVSKQFSIEYTERANKRGAIRVQDNGDGSVAALELPAAAAAASSITFDLVHLDWEGLEGHVEQIQSILAQMTKEPAVRIRFYFQIPWFDFTHDGSELVQDHELELATLQNLAKLEFLELYVSMEPSPTKAEIEGTLLASYEKGKRWKGYRYNPMKAKTEA